MSTPKKRKSNSTKKAKEERLRAEAEKKREFEDKYDRTQELLKELLERPPADLEEHIVALALREKRRVVDGVESKDEEIDYQLRKWKDGQPVLVTGIYKDHDKIKATFQQRFIQLLVASTPSVLEELRPLATLFKEFFGSSGEDFHALFEWHRLDNLVDADQALDSSLSAIVSDTFREMGAEAGGLIQIRPGTFEKFRDDYKWSQYRTLVILSALRGGSPRYGEKLLLQRAWAELKKAIHVDSSVQLDSVTREGLIEALAGRIVPRIFLDASASYFVEQTKHALSSIFKELLPDAESKVGSLIELLLFLYDWAEHHSIEKDWVLRYALQFVGEFSESPTISLTDLSIPAFGDGRLFTTDYFRFAFDTWKPAEKSREDYELELRVKFDKVVDDFFQLWGRHLNLDRHSLPPGSQITRPIDQDFEYVKWLIAWNEGATYRQIAAGFNREKGTVTRGIQSLHEYDLPIRVGVPGRYRSQVSAERIAEIRSLDLSLSSKGSSKDN